MYSIECSGYCCIHNLPVYCTLMYTKLAFENSSVHKTSALTINRISWFYESNESVTLSLSQIIKIKGKYILLCNSFALTLFRLGGGHIVPPPPTVFFPFCAKTGYSRLMKLSDFQYNYIGHHLK